MKKIHVLGLVLFAVFAFSSVIASAAFAESEWLAGGLAIGVALAADTAGTVLLINLEGGAVLIEVECSGLFEGTVGPGAADTITDAVGLEGTVIGTLEEGDTNKTGLSCTVVKTAGGILDCEANSLATVWVDFLNLELSLVWATKIELVGTEFRDDIQAESGYEVECKTPVGSLTNLCGEELTSSKLENMTTEKGVLGIFDANSQSVKCTLTGAASGDLGGSGLITLTNGETLSVS